MHPRQPGRASREQLYLPLPTELLVGRVSVQQSGAQGLRIRVEILGGMNEGAGGGPSGGKPKSTGHINLGDRGLDWRLGQVPSTWVGACVPPGALQPGG